VRLHMQSRGVGVRLKGKVQNARSLSTKVTSVLGLLDGMTNSHIHSVTPFSLVPLQSTIRFHS